MASPSRIPASLAAILGLCISLCAAQDTTPAPTASSSAPAQTHTISVGIDHKFKPEVTQAEIGDILDFRFVPVNHSVVRAEYEFPCIPYEMTGRGKVGFFSGFHPVDAILEDAPSWTIRINDTDPIFVYCSAPGSCINYGMVAVINPNANTSLEKQRQLAKDSAFMLNPGEPFPPEGTPSALATLISSSSASTPASTAAPAASSEPPASSSSSNPLSKGAIAGIAVAGAAILTLAAALFFFIGRSRSMKQELDRNTNTLPPPSSSPYQHHSFLAPKTEMTDASSRNSTLHQSINPHYSSYDSAAAYGHGHGDPKNEYYMHADAIGSGRPEMASPASTGGEFQDQAYSNGRSSGMPQRYPSLALNPHEPREMSTTN